jgi:hypothetical protein
MKKRNKNSYIVSGLSAISSIFTIRTLLYTYSLALDILFDESWRMFDSRISHFLLLIGLIISCFMVLYYKSRLTLIIPSLGTYWLVTDIWERYELLNKIGYYIAGSSQKGESYFILIALIGLLIYSASLIIDHKWISPMLSWFGITPD